VFTPYPPVCQSAYLCLWIKYDVNEIIISASNTIGRSALIFQLRYALFKEEKPVGNNNTNVKN
jgi:hypothetical protein